MDVAIVIDTSGSVKQANFNKVVQFLKLFVDRFDFPDSGTRSVSESSVAYKIDLPGLVLPGNIWKLQHSPWGRGLLYKVLYGDPPPQGGPTPYFFIYHY